MMDHTPVSKALSALGIAHEVFVHPEAPKTLEWAAVERGQKPEQVVRSILFRCEQDEYLMVLKAGAGQIDWKGLRRYLGRSRITMATVEEVLAVTGYRLGAVAPFGFDRQIRVLVDESVLAEEEISMGSGVVGTAVILKSTDLLKALGEVEVGDFGRK
jgi:Cys-tRNA(Pro)/Cys-tRNA(Cys) deacylase